MRRSLALWLFYVPEAVGFSSYIFFLLFSSTLTERDVLDPSREFSNANHFRQRLIFLARLTLFGTTIWCQLQNKQTKETQKKFYFPFPRSVFWQFKKNKIPFPKTRSCFQLHRPFNRAVHQITTRANRGVYYKGNSSLWPTSCTNNIHISVATRSYTPLAHQGMQPIWKTKQKKFSLLGIEMCRPRNDPQTGPEMTPAPKWFPTGPEMSIGSWIHIYIRVYDVQLKGFLNAYNDISFKV